MESTLLSNHILVVDDEDNLRNLVQAYLIAEGYTVDLAEDGQDALSAFRRHLPVLVILDVMLPGMDGLEVLQRIRRESDVYVLLLTAKSEETDRIVGLTIGADDYLTKPFSPRELMARVKAMLRRGRNGSQGEGDILTFAHVSIDGNRYDQRLIVVPVSHRRGRAGKALLRTTNAMKRVVLFVAFIKLISLLKIKSRSSGSVLTILATLRAANIRRPFPTYG